MAETDPVDQPYCCFACFAKFRLGATIAADVLRCPKCRSSDMHPIGQEPQQLKEYHGEVGTVN